MTFWELTGAITLGILAVPVAIFAIYAGYIILHDVLLLVYKLVKRGTNPDWIGSLIALLIGTAIFFIFEGF